MERDARTMFLIGSFLDVSGVSSVALIRDALPEEGISERTDTALQYLADMEKSRDQVVDHLLIMATMVDANIKLLRRTDVIGTLELQSHLAQVAYQLLFDPSGNLLFGEGLEDILWLSDEFNAKRHTRKVEQALVKAIAKPAQAKTNIAQKQGTYSRHRKGKDKKPSVSPAPQSAQLKAVSAAVSGQSSAQLKGKRKDWSS